MTSFFHPSLLKGRILRSSTRIRQSAFFQLYSTKPSTNGRLPLSGLRVLDMTRVLAGVRDVLSVKTCS
jgi:hypothetical protein